MDVPDSRFPYEVLKIIQEVAESHFVAFDLEFSGVASRRPPGTGKLTLQEYYEDVKAAAEKYQILQVGLTVVQEDLKKGRYIARPYNFNISPLTKLRERDFGRTWSYHSGAISFLTRNGFKFDLPITHGVQYLSRKEEQEARLNMIQEEELRSKIADMELKPEDDALIHHIRSAVKQWQSQPKDQQEAYLNIPGDADGVPQTLNGYQIRLTHQIVRNEYPNLKTVGMKHFVQITNPTAEQQASEKLVRSQQREKQIMEAVGFRWLMEAIFAGNISAMPDAYTVNGLSSHDLNGKSPTEFIYTLQEKLRSRRRIMVGHNCFTDLVNLYKCFIGDLPNTVEAFADETRTLLPGVMDTKYIASFGSKRWTNTSLEEVELDLRQEPLPRIDVPAEYDRYLYSTTYHEAGYDSLVTARIAIKLSAKMEREGKYVELQKNNLQGDVPLQAAFGVDDDGYVTAAESVHSQASHNGGVVASITSALSSPVTAFKAFFDKDDISSRKKPNRDDDILASESTPTQYNSETVIAVKEREHSTKWTNKHEVAKIKKALAKTNIYDVLEKDRPGPEADSEVDLMSFSSGSESGSLAKGKNLDAMVKKGEIMPPWDGANRFWKTFGNKLQVNGSQEGVCRLA